MPSDTTLTQYASRIAILDKAGVDAVAKPSSLVAWFKETEQGESSQKLYLSAIKQAVTDPSSIVKGFGVKDDIMIEKEKDRIQNEKNKEKRDAFQKAVDDGKFKTFPKELQNLIDELYGKQNKKDKEQKLSDKQEVKFVPFAEILTAQKTLAKKENKTAEDMKDYLIISLYTLMPPVRADYGDMMLFPKFDKNRSGNELIIKEKGMEFVFREYKTQKTYGVVRIKVSKPLEKVIQEYLDSLKATPSYLFGEKEISPSYFAALVEKTMKRVVGKPVGVSLIRHAYITSVYPSLKTIKQKELLARKMMHSTNLQEQYNLPEKADME